LGAHAQRWAHNRAMGLRRVGLVALVLGVLVTPLTAQPQQPGRTARVGILVPGSPAPEADTYKAFRQGLRERGWIEGQNLILDFRFADNRYGRLPALAAELVALKPDAIFAVASPAIRAAKQATSTIPIVIETLGDRLLEGRLPRRALALVRTWGRLHREELNRDWELARANRPRRRVAPLK
jgi:ABC-type uncharacterized transport system substrate-binding protein